VCEFGCSSLPGIGAVLGLDGAREAFIGGARKWTGVCACARGGIFGTRLKVRLETMGFY